MGTRSKRASSVSLGLLFILAPVAPDATLDQGDRQHIAASYSGILAEDLDLIAPTADATVMVRQRVSAVRVRTRVRTVRVV